MRKVVKASLNDIKILEKAIRRQLSISQENGILVEEEMTNISRLIEDGLVYICKENSIVLAYVILSYFIEEDILKDLDISLGELYEKFPYKEEGLLGIVNFGIDPLNTDEKAGKDLFTSLLSRFSSFSLITCLDPKEIEKMSFLKGMGFNLVYKQGKEIYIRPINDDGLCRNLIW